ncbi:MAG: GGDEF domain-containing protein [Rhodocyclaceae bacterium]|nr:GGDEF domain-containing protein [Rhodocyclaceae bacterium]
MNGTGIVTTQASAGAWMWAGAVAAGLALLGVAVATYGDVPIAIMPSFIPTSSVAAIIVDGLVGYLLIVHFFIFRQPAIGFAASAYGLQACSALVWLMSFPGAFTSDALVGFSSQAAMWIAVFTYIGFPALILAAVLVHWLRGERLIPRDYIPFAVLVCFCAPFIVVAVANWFAVRHLELLPALIRHGDYAALATSPLGAVLWGINVVALIAVTRPGNVFFLWLGVSVFAEFIGMSLWLSAAARHTFEWYAGQAAHLVSAVILLAALQWEVHQLYPLLARANEALYRASVEDGLTGVYNRSYFNNQLPAELARARRQRQPVSLVMIDIDHFKRLNDRYGHPFGDRCLVEVAKRLREQIHRPGDFTARYGGEEFAMVLVGASAKGVRDIAELTRRKIEILRIMPPANQSEMVALTVSMGVATLEADDAADAAGLLAAADGALYGAKAMGRNRVCVAERPAAELIPAVTQNAEVVALGDGGRDAVGNAGADREDR